MDRIRDNNAFCTNRSAQLSGIEAIPAEQNAISRKNSANRVIEKINSCFSIGDDPIADMVNREPTHLESGVTFRRFENFMNGGQIR
jgi:hypothetical protein